MTAALLALFFGLIAYEAKAWFPRAIEGLIGVAVRRLPKRQRDRFREEWRAHIHDTPGAVMRLWHAVGFIVASSRMYPRWRSAVAQQRAYRRGELLTRATTRFLDLSLVVAALVFLAPLLVAITFVLKTDGPPIFRQLRIGRGGRLFYVYKFRTMSVADCDGDVRITPLGRFLRATHLDLLPQLINVLRGEMSFVGPRPSPLTFRSDDDSVLEPRPEDIRITVKPGAWNEKPGLTDLAFPGEGIVESHQPHRVGQSVKRYFRALILAIKRFFTP